MRLHIHIMGDKLLLNIIKPRRHFCTIGEVAITTLCFHMWNYKLTLKFRSKIKEWFFTHDIMIETIESVKMMMDCRNDMPPFTGILELITVYLTIIPQNWNQCIESGFVNVAISYELHIFQDEIELNNCFITVHI